MLITNVELRENQQKGETRVTAGNGNGERGRAKVDKGRERPKASNKPSEKGRGKCAVMALKPSLDAYAAFIHRLHLRPPPPRSPDLPPPPLHGLTFAVKDMHVLLLVLTSPLLLTPDHYPH